jgi:hypothetical protein
MLYICEAILNGIRKSHSTAHTISGTLSVDNSHNFQFIDTYTLQSHNNANHTKQTPDWRTDISFKNGAVPVKTGQMETLLKPITKTWKFTVMQELIINWALGLTSLFPFHTF